MQEAPLVLQVNRRLLAQRWVEAFIRLEEYPQTEGAPTEYQLELKYMSEPSVTEFLLWIQQAQEDASFPFDTRVAKKAEQLWICCAIGAYVGVLAGLPIIAMVLCACMPWYGWIIALSLAFTMAAFGLLAGYFSKTTILYLSRKNNSTLIEFTQSRHNTNDVER